MTEKLLYSIADTQEMLGGACRSTIYNLAAAGELAFVHIGRRAFVTAQSLTAYVDRLIQGAQSAAGAKAGGPT